MAKRTTERIIDSSYSDVKRASAYSSGASTSTSTVMAHTHDDRYLYRENIGIFIPDGNYEPATKVYTDTQRKLVDVYLGRQFAGQPQGLLAILTAGVNTSAVGTAEVWFDAQGITLGSPLGLLFTLTQAQNTALTLRAKYNNKIYSVILS